MAVNKAAFLSLSGVTSEKTSRAQSNIPHLAHSQVNFHQNLVLEILNISLTPKEDD